MLLQRYTGQHTVVFGATVSGRPADLPVSRTRSGCSSIPCRWW
ncbi:hypothetical protein P4133_00370 [Pseudomonas aeruginosa]|nr:hypothetical protein [Pseudomonas aeruginosa]